MCRRKNVKFDEVLFRPLLIILLCQSLTLRLLLKNVGSKLCQTNFRLFKTIALEILLLVLLGSSLLGANKFTPSSCTLMDLLIDIKLVWWHLGVARRIVLIMRKRLLLWPR